MGLQENVKTDQVSQLEVRDAICLSKDEPLGNAIQSMREKNLGSVVVIDAERKPIGIFTESMLTELLSHGPIPLEDPIETHMSNRCPWVKTTDPIEEMLDALQLKNVRMLCVVDEDGKVAGVTGQRGLMEFIADHFPGQVMVQRVGQTPYLAEKEGA